MYASECALRVLIKGRGDDGRGYDSDGEVLRRGSGEHAVEMNANPLFSLVFFKGT